MKTFQEFLDESQSSSDEGEDFGPHIARIQHANGSVYDKRFKSSAALEKHLDAKDGHKVLAMSKLEDREL